MTQDEKLRIRKRKRSRKIWNRCGNTTGNTRFRCRLCDVYSCFHWCGYSGTGPHFTRFRQVSVEGNKSFRKRNFMLTCAETYDNVPETWIFYISVDVITSKRSGKCKITFRFSLVSVNLMRPIVPRNTRLLFWIKFSSVFADLFRSRGTETLRIFPETRSFLVVVFSLHIADPLNTRYFLCHYRAGNNHVVIVLFFI